MTASIIQLFAAIIVTSMLITVVYTDMYNAYTDRGTDDLLAAPKT